MWSTSVFANIAKLSVNHATLATFTAARTVRDGLTNAGFTITKQKGYGRKREMITATLTTPYQPIGHWTDLPTPISRGTNITIIGAGLAGATTARSLAEAGYPVTVFHDPIHHSAASNVPVAVPYLQPGLKDSPMRQFHLAAWHHLKRRITPYQAYIDHLPIVLEAETDADQKRHQAVFAQQLLNSKEWTITPNGDITLHGLGIINTPALLTALLDHPNIHIEQREVTTLPNTPTVIATAWEHNLLPSEWHQQLRPLRGLSLIHI